MPNEPNLRPWIRGSLDDCTLSRKSNPESHLASSSLSPTQTMQMFYFYTTHEHPVYFKDAL